jgi:phage/plasmid-like protein (TIGR03299 family)
MYQTALNVQPRSQCQPDLVRNNERSKEMPPEIEQMFSVREMPWHRDADVLDDYPQTFAEARKRAGQDWDPIALPATERLMPVSVLRDHIAREVRNSAALPVDETTENLLRIYEKSLRTDPAFRRIARSDNLHTLSYQRDSYNIIPNSAFGEIIDSVIGAEPDTVKLETGGCLADGRKVWMLARLDEPMQIQTLTRRDESLTFPFLGITSSHDGHASCAARLTTVRICCANTFGAAEAEGQRTGAVYAFSHRSDWREKMGEAREALQFARDEAADYAVAMSDLLGIAVTPVQEQLFLREFIPAPPDGIISDRVAKNIAEARAAVQGFLDSPTVEGAGIRGTAYGLVQASGEYLDWVRVARTPESRMNRSLLRIEPLKAKAAVLAREVASA